MTQLDWIVCLAIACPALLALAIIFYCDSHIQYRARVIAERKAEQHAANARSAHHRADLHKKAQEQATSRANMLAAHVAELERENEEKSARILHLADLIRRTDAETITEMAVMRSPQVLNLNDTVNLN